MSIEFFIVRHSRESGNPIWLTVVKREITPLSLVKRAILSV